MKPFNLEEVRANEPFEVYFEQVGWVAGHLLRVEIEPLRHCKVKVGFASLDTHDTEWFLLPNERLRMKEG